MIIKAGELVLLSAGEYSDYGGIALGRATADIDIEAIAREYADANAPNTSRYFDEFKFAKWLVVDKRLIDEVSYKEWHLGWGYGREAEFSLSDGESL